MKLPSYFLPVEYQTLVRTQYISVYFCVWISSNVTLCFSESCSGTLSYVNFNGSFCAYSSIQFLKTLRIITTSYWAKWLLKWCKNIFFWILIFRLDIKYWNCNIFVMDIICNYLLYKKSLHKIASMSAFEMCHKIYLFELFCVKTFVPFLTLVRDHGRCSLTVNYATVTSLVLVLQNK